METVKVKAWAASQGDFVLINKDEFDQDKHELFDDAGAKKADLNVNQLKEELTAKGIEIPEGAKKADLVSLLEQYK
ncbi:HeH/LEM domain-containing protein [Undibacterium sp. SXout7W]|uniref:HeH/LEM domain-containing protein n=1 Tax=Undibacterium sp. SXout7W TaxID=3413049 RepID=UPI003BF296B6